MSSRRNQLLELLKDSPADSELLYFIAMESVGEGDDPRAEKEFRHLLEVDAGHVAAHLQLGQVLVRMGEEDQARKVYAAGMVAAQKCGNQHAYSELAGFLEALG